MLAPDIVGRADQAAVRLGVATGMGVAEEIRGSDAVARAVAQLSWAPAPGLVDGSAALAYALGGVPRTVFRFRVEEGFIAGLDIQADLTGLDIVLT